MELNKIHNIDCLEFMKTLPDKCIDLVLTDPPYGIGIAKTGMVSGYRNLQGNSEKIGFKNQKDYGKQNWDNNIPTKEYFDEMFRISKNQIIFGGNYFVEYLPNSSCWLVWDKKENVANDFADCELVYTSFKTSVRKFTYGWTGFEGINNSNKHNDKKQHPTQKPLELLLWIIKNYSKERDTIFDPFLGSGTTAVACKLLKRNYIGCEISKEYCDIAEARIKAISNTLF